MWHHGVSMTGSWGLGFGILGFVFWIIVIVVIIVLIRFALRGGHRGRCCQADENSALIILKERYAKGEIDKKEFEEKMKDLTK